MEDIGIINLPKRSHTAVNWSLNDLPYQIIEDILSRLPIQYLLVARCVCKEWNAISFCPTFRNRYKRTAQPHMFLAFKGGPWNGKQPLIMYDGTKHGNWYSLPNIPAFKYSDAHTAAADGGLVVYADADFTGLKEYYVSNPITRTFRKLKNPPVHETRSYLTHKIINEPTVLFVNMHTSYRLILVGIVVETDLLRERFHMGSQSVSLTIYDSKTQCWEEKDLALIGHPGEFSFEPHGKMSCVYNGGIVYVLCTSSANGTLMTYDVHKEVWKRSPVHFPNLDHYYFNVKMVKHAGRLYLVIMVEDENWDHMAQNAVLLWELQLKDLSWNEIDRMSIPVFQKFYNNKVFRECRKYWPVCIECCQFRDLVLLVSFAGDCRSNGFKICGYDLSQKMWMPILDTFRHACPAFHFFNGVIFEPSLDDTP